MASEIGFVGALGQRLQRQAVASRFVRQATATGSALSVCRRAREQASFSVHPDLRPRSLTP